MRILGLTDQTIDPPASGGAERIRVLYERLARGNDVEVIDLVGFREPKGLRRVAPRLVIRRVPAPQRTLAFYLDRARIAPAFAAHYAHALLAPLYAPLLRSAGWDIVQVDGVALGPLARLVPPGAPVVYSAHNVEAEFHGAALRGYRFSDAFARVLSRIERAFVRRAALVLAVSDRDADLLAAVCEVDRGKIVTVPNGFDEERFRLPSCDERRARRERLGFAPDERVVVFPGSRAPHNEEAARALVARVAPRLPDRFRLLIAGSVGDAMEPARDPRVTITGSVPDVLPFLEAADVAVNPVESGGGTNIKVLQCLAVGLPVVSTPFGMRGLDALRPFVRVAPLGEMADALAAAAARPAGQPEALASALAAHSWGAGAARIERAYADLLARRAPRPTPSEERAEVLL